MILIAPKMEGIILLGIIDLIKITITVMVIKEIIITMKMIEVIIIIIIMDIIIMIDITITEEMIGETSFGKDIKINKFKLFKILNKFKFMIIYFTKYNH